MERVFLHSAEQFLNVGQHFVGVILGLNLMVGFRNLSVGTNQKGHSMNALVLAPHKLFRTPYAKGIDDFR